MKTEPEAPPSDGGGLVGDVEKLATRALCGRSTGANERDALLPDAAAGGVVRRARELHAGSLQGVASNELVDWISVALAAHEEAHQHVLR